MIPEKLSSCKFYLCGSSSTTERFALFEEKGGVVTVPRLQRAEKFLSTKFIFQIAK